MDAKAQSPTPKAQLVYLGLGSNQGDREQNLRAAVERLRGIFEVDAVSSIYETEPVGFQQQPDFLNIVVRVRTTMRPEEVMAVLLGIERAMGRERTFRNAPRLIDVDLLLHGDLIVDMPELVVPHPRMVGRAFTLLPLLELDPSLRHPMTGERLADVAARTPLERATRLGALGRGAARLLAALALSLAGFLAACSGSGEATDGSDPELDRMVAEVLPSIERVADMPARSPIRAERRSREELRDYLTQRMAEEMPPEEMEATEALYRELGLLPDTIDLRGLLLDLLTEQVVGYYDPPSETLYLIEGASEAMAREVLAHELVHALQDQYVDLDSLLSPEIANDRATAAQSAIEGHATLVMFALMLSERTGDTRDITEMPDIGQQLRPALEAGNDRMPIFRDAPRIIRETLIFPYIAGAGYVQARWTEHEGEGRPDFASILPTSTEQVLHARERMGEPRDEPTRVALAAPRGDWRIVHEEVLGELELGLLLRAHIGSAGGDADRAVAGWDGDLVRLVESGLGERALVIGTAWDSAADADEFADAYRRVLTERSRHGSVERATLEGRELVVIVDAPLGVPRSLLPTPSVQALTR